MPLFVYDEHVAHHSVASYGTHEDSEYLPLRPARLVRSMALMAVSVLLVSYWGVVMAVNVLLVSFWDVVMAVNVLLICYYGIVMAVNVLLMSY